MGRLVEQHDYLRKQIKRGSKRIKKVFVQAPDDEKTANNPDWFSFHLNDVDWRLIRPHAHQSEVAILGDGPSTCIHLKMRK